MGLLAGGWSNQVNQRLLALLVSFLLLQVILVLTSQAHIIMTDGLRRCQKAEGQ